MNWTINGEETTVRIENTLECRTAYLNDEPTLFQILERTEDGAVINIHGQNHRVFVLPDRNGCTVWWKGRTFRLERVGSRNAAHVVLQPADGEVRAAMPGKVLRIHVETGSNVDANQPLIVMESMKMETTIHAPRSGRINEVHVKPGQVVEMDALLMTIALSDSL